LKKGSKQQSAAFEPGKTCRTKASGVPAQNTYLVTAAARKNSRLVVITTTNLNEISR
jgi:hypothetical protein